LMSLWLLHSSSYLTYLTYIDQSNLINCYYKADYVWLIVSNCFVSDWAINYYDSRSSVGKDDIGYASSAKMSNNT
jgi:hypothetical protein